MCRSDKIPAHTPYTNRVMMQGDLRDSMGSVPFETSRLPMGPLGAQGFKRDKTEKRGRT